MVSFLEHKELVMRSELVFLAPRTNFEKVEPEGEVEGFDCYLKELIPEGTWQHPTKGFKLPVTRARIEGWVQKFNSEQQPRNIQVPVPHGHTYNTKLNAGFCETLECKQNERGTYSLFGNLRIPQGDDSDKIGTTIRDVSVSVHPNLRYANGETGDVEKLGECIEHVALTNYPVVNGMAGFVKLDTTGEKTVALCFGHIAEETEFEANIPTSEKELVEFATELTKQKHLALGVPVPQEIVDGKKGKAIQSEVSYRSGTGDANCGKCLFFMRPKEGDYTEQYLTGNCVYVEDPIKSVDVCDFYQSRYGLEDLQQNLEEGEIPMPTAEQLRAMEQKFDLEGNSLTEDNWFEKINSIDLSTTSEGGGKSTPTPTPKPEEQQTFDITQSPEFQALQQQNHQLLLDRNSGRLSDVRLRLQNALSTGRINKAALDKIVKNDQQLTFSSDSCHGTEWDSWLEGVEAQLSVIEALPEAASLETGRITDSLGPALLDQNEDEAKKMDAEIDDLISAACPDYHMDAVKLDPTTGLFTSQR